MIFQLLFLLESSPAQLAGMRLVLGVGPPDVAVVGGVRGEGLPAVLTLEGPLPGVLADMCPQDTGGSEGLEEKTLLLYVFFFFSFVKFTITMEV